METRDLKERIYNLEEQVNYLISKQKQKTSKVTSIWIECGYCGRRKNSGGLPTTLDCEYCGKHSTIFYNFLDSHEQQKKVQTKNKGDN